jgi:hypothetical protein
MACRESYAIACSGYRARTLTKIGTVTRERFRRSLMRNSLSRLICSIANRKEGRRAVGLHGRRLTYRNLTTSIALPRASPVTETCN